MYEIVPVRKWSNNWIISKDNLSKKDIAKAFSFTKVIVSDLDDTLAPSPAMKYVISNLYKQRTWQWAAEAFKKRNDDAQSELWFKYIGTNISNEEREALMNIPMLTTPYQGVEEVLLSQSENRRKILLTRNIEEIANSYERNFEFHEGHYEVRDKTETLSSLMNDVDYTLFGDSKEDFELAANAVLSVCISKSPEDYEKNYSNNFTIGMGRNWTPLANILKEK